MEITTSGFSEVWYRAWFGTKRPWVQVPQPGPKRRRLLPPPFWYPYLAAGLEQGGGSSESPPHGEEKAFAAACAFSPALAPGLLLSKSNPLRWASICFSLYPAPYPISSLAPRQNSTKDHLAAQAAPNRPKVLFFLSKLDPRYWVLRLF